MQEADQTFLVIDRQIVTEVPLESAVLSLMASYFVFNVCYPRGCCNLFMFLESKVLKLPSHKASLTVKNFMSNLCVH